MEGEGGGIPHREIIPPVINCPYPICQLADFGLSAFFSPGTPLTERVGSPYFVAPEVNALAFRVSPGILACPSILAPLITLPPSALALVVWLGPHAELRPSRRPVVLRCHPFRHALGRVSLWRRIDRGYLQSEGPGTRDCFARSVQLASHSAAK